MKAAMSISTGWAASRAVIRGRSSFSMHSTKAAMSSTITSRPPSRRRQRLRGIIGTRSSVEPHILIGIEGVAFRLNEAGVGVVDLDARAVGVEGGGGPVADEDDSLDAAARMAHVAEASGDDRRGNAAFELHGDGAEVLGVVLDVLGEEVVAGEGGDGLGLSSGEPVDDGEGVDADVEHLALGLREREVGVALLLLADDVLGRSPGGPLANISSQWMARRVPIAPLSMACLARWTQPEWTIEYIWLTTPALSMASTMASAASTLPQRGLSR